MRLFTKAKPSSADPKESINKLRDTLDLLEKRESYLQAKCEKEVVDAKKIFAGEE